MQIDWTAYVNGLLSVTKFRVNPDEPVIVFGPVFLQNMSAMVTEMMQKLEGRRYSYLFIYFV